MSGLWNYSPIHYTGMAIVQHNGGVVNIDHQAWSYGGVVNTHIGMGYPTPKDTLWLPLWCASQYKVFTLHGIDKTKSYTYC